MRRPTIAGSIPRRVVSTSGSSGIRYNPAFFHRQRLSMLLGVDTGGTFTDFVLFDGATLRLHKVLSTPDDPSAAIQRGIVGTRSERRRRGRTRDDRARQHRRDECGARRQRRTHRIRDESRLHRCAADRPPGASRLICAGAPRDSGPRSGRICASAPADGSRIPARCIDALTTSDLEALRRQIVALKPEAIAINLLYSYVDDTFERAIESALQDLAFVCRSSEVLPEYKEFERGIATWLNAWLGPVVDRYLQKLSRSVAPCPVVVMQSSGGTIGAAQARRRAVNLLLSGPAGGLAAARHVGVDDQSAQPADVRHGRHVDRRRARGRSPHDHERRIDRTLSGRRADGGHSHDRIRRRLDRVPRHRGCVARGSTIGRRKPGTRVLRPRRHRADRHRRQRRARTPAGVAASGGDARIARRPRDRLDGTDRGAAGNRPPRSGRRRRRHRQPTHGSSAASDFARTRSRPAPLLPRVVRRRRGAPRLRACRGARNSDASSYRRTAACFRRWECWSRTRRDS